MTRVSPLDALSYANVLAALQRGGGRIEELCALELRNVHDYKFSIADSKTEAGYREVPIHPAIVPLLRRVTYPEMRVA